MPCPDEPMTDEQNPTPGLSIDEALEQTRKERDEYLLGWKRALADYENAKKQQLQMREEDRRRVRMNLAEDLLAVVDNFGYVTKNIPDVSGCPDDFQKKFTGWVSGISHIDRQFTECMKSLGAEPIEAMDQPFDAKLHEAAGSRKADGKKEGIVIEEMVKGWKMGDVVLRPSKVIVSE